MKVGGLGNPEKVTSSGLPDRLQRVIGDKKHKKLLGPGCQGALHMLRSWHLMLLLVVRRGIGRLTMKGFHTKRG